MFIRKSLSYLKYFICLVILTSSFSLKAQDDLVLWYDKPAQDWMTEALPLGNGYMGVMFFGGIAKEQLQFTEGSLWSGGPNSSKSYNYGNKPESWKHLQKVRDLIKEGKLQEANSLAGRYFTGIGPKPTDGKSEWGDYGGQQTMGDLFVSIDHGDVPVQGYKRQIDIEKAVATVNYSIGKTKYQREYFGNYPSGMMVYKFKSTKPSSYSIEYKTPHVKDSEVFENNRLTFNGHVNDNHQEFQTAYKVITDGKVDYQSGKVNVKNAKYVILMHTAATDYLMEYPKYKGNDYKSVVSKRFEKIANLGYDQVLKEHLFDYRNLFNRVSLLIKGSKGSELPTNLRQKAYFEGANDLGLEELYFQYGRYLMIAGSRPGTMLMNLQGKWNNSVSPPWAADYHMNINQQMIYWPAEVTNLAESHEPLLKYVNSLVTPGQQTAKDFFNTRGWVVNTMNNAYGYTAPGWGLPWGFFPGGGAWLAQHLWDHYEFGLDTAYLRETAYPVMKEAALFWIDYLIEDENGALVSSPSYSPEHGGISGGASMDHQIAWDVLNNCAKAALILNDPAFAKKASEVRDRILAPQIGRWGQLQEWKEDVDDSTSKHRHISHLFALHPGRQISPSKTPKLAEAARVTLEARGDDATGWSLGWKVNFWARLKDGDRAYKLYRMILKPSGAGGSGSGSYANLLDAHPPFQLDGNMGATAGVAEMLVQSQTGEIELLPALSSVWKSGAVKGLRARGGYTVDIAWENNKLKEVRIKASADGDCKLSYDGKNFSAPVKAGKTLVLKQSDIIGK